MKNELHRKLNLQFFAEPIDGGNGDPEPQDPPAGDDPTPTEPKEPVKDDKTFTQTELDDIIAKRIERERKKYEGFDDLKKKAADYEKQLEEKRLAELSEKERAEEIAKKAEEEKAELARQLNEFKSQVERERIHNEFIKQAQAANIAYIDDAIALADLSAVTVEDGKVSGVDDVIKSLIENKPFLLAQAKKEPKKIGNPSNPSDDKSQKTSEQLLAEAADKARKTGRTEDRIAYATLKRELNQ